MKYWFKRKDYGWGWTPANWRGWLVLVVYLVLEIVLVKWLNIDDSDRGVMTFVLATIGLALVLVAVCYKTGEKPKWQWGKKK
jgi:hypothetical protein